MFRPVLQCWLGGVGKKWGVGPGCSIIVPICGHPSRISRLLRDLYNRACRGFRIIIMRSNSTVPYGRIIGGCARVLSIRCFRGPGSKPKRAHGCTTRHDHKRCLLVLSSSYVLPRACLTTIRTGLRQRPTSTFKNPSQTRSSFSSMRGTVGCTVASFFAAKNVQNNGGGVSGFCPHDFGVKIHTRICGTLNKFSTVHFNRSVSFDVHVFGKNCHYHLFPRT